MKRASAPAYDLFKLVVTIILTLILLLMLLRGCATISAAPVATEEVSVLEPASASQTSEPVPTETLVILASDTPDLPVPTSTPTIAVPTATLTAAPIDASPTPTADGIATTVPDTAVNVTATPAGEQSSSCNTSVPSRLSAGQNARVTQRLNLRSQPAITAPILQTNPTNAQVEIIGGPVCTPVNDRAYLWWQIRLADGTEGWSAEAQLNEAIYLLEPVP